MKPLEEQFKDLEKEINQGKIEAGFRKQQLNEFKPKRQEYENESVTTFNVPIQQIADYIAEQEQEAIAKIEQLEAALEEAKQVT